jgi:fluoride exporter
VLALPPCHRYIAAMPNLLLVMLGGAIGAGARHLAGVAGLRWLGPGFPWATLFVNLLGSLLMGLLAGWLVRAGGSEQARLFLAVGVLGGFTTFSAFSLETFLMLQRGETAAAAAYVAASVIGGVLLLFTGLWLMRAGAGAPA